MVLSNFDALRRASENGSGNNSETVAVNHRALITRTLSKYPVDHALFRELIQNSADAGATTVKIEFTTEGSKSPIKLDNIMDIQKTTVKRLRVSNNGMFFRPEDWDRLREIAKGNPDETKIGAFGVGFYSVFAVTDEPMVISGSTAMSFYYIGDQLHYRRIEVPDITQKEAGQWTFIDLPYSAPKPLPDLSQFTSFLAQSLTFVKLQQIEFTVDDISLLVIQKIKSDPSDLQIPKEVNLRSLERSMKLDRVETESVQIKARYLNVTQLGKSEVEVKGLMSFGLKFIQAFSADTEKPTEYSDAVLFLRNITGYITTNPAPAFAQKLKGAIMKPPPRIASVSMIALNKVEADSSQLKSGIAAQIFPKTFADAKVFIGFPTKQTTGLKSHIATPQAIPTMERAAVDTANAYVKDWNKEMMYMAGVLTRVVYGTEMGSIGLLLPKDKELKDLSVIFDKATFTMRQFAFEGSTPDARIGDYIATGFWKSATSIPLVTTKGVKSSTEARAMEDITFLQDTAMIPKEMYDGAPAFHDQVKALGLIRSVEVQDIKAEFSKRPLNAANMIAFLKWAFKKLRIDELSIADVRAMIGFALLADENMPTVDMRSLAYYHNSVLIPSNMPVPYNCLPYGVAKELSNDNMEKIGWRSLDVMTWVSFLASGYNSLPVEQNLEVTPDFAREVLITVSKQWSTSPNSSKISLFESLRNMTCIPTQKGMKRPGESYLNEVKMFPDLPVVNENVRNGVNEDMIVYFGVRKTVELKYVMERLHADEKSRKWSSEDVIIYLASQRKDMRREDLEFLKTSDIVSAEDSDRLCKVSTLYQPIDDLQDLKLPILKWTSNWSPKSSEAQFLFSLGLNKYPAVQTLINIAATASTEDDRNKALNYFVTYYDQNKYRSVYNARQNIKFLPATITRDGNSEAVIVSPNECFTSSSVKLFEFPVLKDDLQVEGWKFGVSMYPPVEYLIDRLISRPPKDNEEAKKMFGFMATNISNLRPKDVAILKDACFVPVVSESGVLKYQSPSNVFIILSLSDDDSDLFYKSFFDFVNFDIGANAFLRYCGARDKPSILELAKLTIHQPGTMLAQAGSTTRYQELLLEFNRNWQELSADSNLLADMKNSAFLLAIKIDEKEKSGELSKAKSKNTSLLVSDMDDLDDLMDDDISYVLAQAPDIIINDDVINYNLFKRDIFMAPFELEQFYLKIGSPKLSNIVQETVSLGAVTNAADTASVRKRVLERLKIFLDVLSRDSLKLPFNVFEKQFLLASVTRISVQRTIPRSRKRRVEPVASFTTAAAQKRADQGWTLYLVPKFEWFDVAQSLVKTLLKRPTPDSATVLESLLNSTLSSLERRGYDVKRLINKNRQEAEAAKLAEQKLVQEAREKERLRITMEEQAYAQKMQEQLQSRISEEDKLDSAPFVTRDNNNQLASAAAAAKMSGTTSQQTQDLVAVATAAAQAAQALSAQQQQTGLSSMFNKFRKSTTVSTDSSIAHTATVSALPPPSIHGSRQGHAKLPASWDDSDDEQAASMQSTTVAHPPAARERSRGNGVPLTDEATRQLLRQGIQHTQPYNSNSLRNDQQSWTPGADVSEAAYTTAEQMCDKNAAHDLKFLGNVSNTGPKFFIAKSLASAGIPRELNPHIKLFAQTLRELALNVFDTRWDAFHMYYDEEGRSIAFNSNGSLFFNLRYFVKDVRSTQTLHAGGYNMAKALDYWFPVVAHELAHNLEPSHGQQHSYFTETYIQQYAAAYRRVAKNHDNGA
ncbi:uncharacterized protein V1518DRAFT_411963 [Limtongia smithiae]|uniref:uncharacterized protein n=1 Tax=Limtongia smithiae TaxID=1125753 RepID=UPI0034CDB9E7